MEEAKECLEMLSVDSKAQAAFGLSWFLALRPGELSALRWEDFTEDKVTIRRSAWKGLVGATKTGTELEVPLIPPAKELFERYALDQYASGVAGRTSPPTLRGWLFPNPSGSRPLDMSAYANRVLRRILKDRYKGLYSCRRGMATTLVEATGNAVSAQGMLRHASMQTTLAFYKKQTPQETLRGMRLLAEEWNKKNEEKKQTR